MENLQLKQLRNAYKKSFKKLNKTLVKEKEAGIQLFIEHLKFIRDLLILSSEEDLSKINIINTKIATLNTAIAEFEASKTSTQKTFHWNNFCELFKQNMGDWLELNDSF